MDVAAAAVKLADPSAAGSGSVADEHEIPAIAAPPPPRAAKPATKYKSGGREPGNSASIFVGAGRAAGVRPGDLVGAIVNEAKVSPATSARSRSPSGSRWWRCRRKSPSRSSALSEAR